MENLKKELDKYIKELAVKTDGKIALTEELLDSLHSVYPFNRFEYAISHLIANDIITIDQYLDIRNSYLERNKYLHLFEINAPRRFGETWAQNHLNELVPELRLPNKKHDEKYSGEYDFWLDGGTRIEVKASRAVDANSSESLVMKALSTDSEKSFNMNFQQIKPDCCDVFVWIGVWRDVIKHWVLSSNEVKNSTYFSKGQHRGNVGEGQLWITEKNIADFEKLTKKELQRIEDWVNHYPKVSEIFASVKLWRTLRTYITSVKMTQR